MASGDLLLVGRVARAHGNRGQVIVNLETDFPEQRFRIGAGLIVGPQETGETREIREVRFHQGRPVISLSGIDTMTAAETLAGADLWMSAGAMEPLPEGMFYRHDLVGCEVRDIAGAVLGRVSRVEGPLDRSLLVVEGTGGEAMIPMVAGICVRVDIGARLIIVNPPDGLLDVNAPTPGGAAGNGRGR